MNSGPSVAFLTIKALAPLLNSRVCAGRLEIQKFGQSTPFAKRMTLLVTWPPPRPETSPCWTRVAEQAPDADGTPDGYSRVTVKDVSGTTDWTCSRVAVSAGSHGAAN